MKGEKAGAFKNITELFDRYMGVFFLVPGIIIMGLIIVYPIVTNILLSFTDAHLIRGISKNVGFDNYLRIIKDPFFMNSLYTTLLWTVGSLILQFSFGLITALLLNNPNIKAKGIFRTLIFVPYTLPIIVVTILWRWILNRFYGIINYLLVAVGVINNNVSWFSSSVTVMPSLVVMNTWFGYPLIALSIFAGLQTIPKEFYEVAEIEGASYWQTFIYVILPSIKRILIMLLILRTIWIFNAFDMIYLVTGGGPNRMTEILTIYGYNLGWKEYWIGRAAALSVILFVILFFLIIFYMKGLKLEEE